MFRFWQLHDVFICEVVYFPCCVIIQENFTPELKRYKVELWEIFYLTKANGDNKVLRFGSKSFYLGTNDRDNINKKVKNIVVIHICNEFDMLFWCFGGGYIFIFNNMKSDCSWELFIVFLCCSKFRICVCWEDKGIYVVIFWFEIFVCWLVIVFW